ncbi:PREDICTED: leukotriene B4 receptor 1-like [Nanorana parkeri]|uniref:leukotriene B4 receptor 1-like n=1 Tax=Nanorana parkeri TaxID=125878 RepID=UPI00085490E7|nr:PREDICTED: leukotriene B4 receptor 1-like [Nanorana parkeri]
MASVNSSFTPSNISSSTSGTSASLGIAILSVALIIGFPGNAFVIWTVLTQVKKRTVTCIIILHLAIADMVLILTAPIFIHFLSTGNWVFGNVICKMCHYIGNLSMYTSIFLITFMSVDRFFAVAKPFTSQQVRTKPVVRSIMFGIWILAMLFAIPMPINRSVETKNNRQQCVTVQGEEDGVKHHLVFQYLFETLMGFFIPFTIILSSYIYIGIRLLRAKFQSKQRTSRLVIIIILTFALFWLPYHVVNMLQVSGELSLSKSLREASKFARPNATALAFFSSSINPILYVFAGGNFIRTAGVGFMAKLFEASGSEAGSIRKVSQVFQQRSRKQSTEQGKLKENVEE